MNRTPVARHHALVFEASCRPFSSTFPNLAESIGFEPMIRFDPDARFPSAWFKPLTQLSMAETVGVDPTCPLRELSFSKRAELPFSHVSKNFQTIKIRPSSGRLVFSEFVCFLR